MSDIRDEMRDIINLLESVINAEEGFSPQPLQDPHARSRLAQAKTAGYSNGDEYAAAQIPEWPISNQDPIGLRNRVQSQYNMYKNEWDSWIQQGLIVPKSKPKFNISKYL